MSERTPPAPSSLVPLATAVLGALLAALVSLLERINCDFQVAGQVREVSRVVHSGSRDP